jgi:hypothetical protein
MAGRTDFIVNGSFEHVAGGDALAWINQSPVPDSGDAHYEYRNDVPPDGWTVTSQFFGVETQTPPATQVSWDGKVWGLLHNGSIAQQVSGLTAGVVYDLTFIAYRPPVRTDVSDLKVFWNGQQVADFNNLHDDVGGMLHVTVTAGAGTNQLEFRAVNVVTMDDVRLFAAGPGDTVDYSQSTLAVGVNLSDEQFKSQYPDVPGITVLPTLSAQHTYTGSGGQTINGVTNVIGSPLNDLLVAATKGGTMAGGAGDDALIGGPGNDTINGGTGTDLIIGGDGQNYLRGDEGDDSLAGGAGFDDINGNMGNDTCHGNAGDDWVVGGKDDDQLFGDAGDDIVWGNLGNDTLDGGDGNDQVRGGQGDDSVAGGAGNDFVSGDRGNDTITGGAGADIFHGSQDAGIDRVLDPPVGGRPRNAGPRHHLHDQSGGRRHGDRHGRRQSDDPGRRAAEHAAARNNLWLLGARSP